MEFLASHLGLVHAGLNTALLIWALLQRFDKALLAHLSTSLEPRLGAMDEKLDEIRRLVQRERRRRRRQHKRILRLEDRKSH